MGKAFIHPTADVGVLAKIGDNSKIWSYSQVCGESMIGESVIVGRNVYIGSGVQIGANCKIQNNALIYEPATLEDGVFIGPAVILTNDAYPRAVNPDGVLKEKKDWNTVGVTIRQGASVGAGSICVAPVEIGAWALVAAGSIVTNNVTSFALVAGSPAKRIRWVGKAGFPLTEIGGGKFICPQTGIYYQELTSNNLIEISS